MRAQFDTNILIDHLSGVAAARAELARVAKPPISLITRQSGSRIGFDAVPGLPCSSAWAPIPS